MSSSHFTGLAGLARKALQMTSIKPRLPSRYEGQVTAQPDAAAWAADTAAARTAPTPVPMPANAAAPGGRAASLIDPADPAPPAQADAMAGARTARSSTPTAAAAAPDSGETASLAAPAVDREARVAAAPAHVPAARRAAAGALLSQALPEAPLVQPMPPVPLRGLPVDPHPTSASAAAQPEGALVQTLRERMAQQLARLQDEHDATPALARQRAGRDAWADPAASSTPAASSAPTAALNARPAWPSVEITIGSIAITLTQAPVVAPARAAAPLAGTAVQSLDAYLQARQRRGGR